MTEQQARTTAANLEAQAVAQADAQQALFYHELAKLWTWIADRWHEERPKDLSNSYIRIRSKLQEYGSYDTLPGGTDRFEKTEAAVDRVLSLLKHKEE